jgi:hypothetical protein
LEDPSNLVVEVHRPGERVRAGPLLKDHDRPAALSEQDPEDETDWAGSDNRDVHRRNGVVLDRHDQAWRSGW